ncbi:flagellar motor protein MotA [Methylomonas sp. LWB]|uniref:MotA/TolQ/ExbB proton channel family protein n=1 Tax=Methylomonas sp. LWB TaxID=1905845 RepID=UPI0008DAE552|nr:MotA/TolQ/ExbB proton channel family protein [Methylomonas sp. LWB]OHX36366.1 flagellar motor protein MotA [Methylomonas sp. LWB]
MFEMFDQAKIVDATLYVLLLFSVITWVLILFKTWQFSKCGYYNRRYSAAFWDAPDLDAAARLAELQSNGTTVRIAVHGFKWLSQFHQPERVDAMRFRGEPRKLLEQTLRNQTQEQQRRIESGLTMLASIGSTAPFVGLLGTVLGIMKAMHDISRNGSASLDVVAGPIGDALIATAIGIAVAVPAVLAYNFFMRQAKHHRAALEHFVDGFLHITQGDQQPFGLKVVDAPVRLSRGL